jgi:hypothetical protein
MAEFKNFDSSVLEGHLKFREKKTVRNHFADAKCFNRVCIIFSYFYVISVVSFTPLDSGFLEIIRAEPPARLKLFIVLFVFYFSGSDGGVSSGDSPLWPIH